MTEPPMATCPRDGAPLIPTTHFPKAEFYCLECGAKLGFLSPLPVTPSPALDVRYAALKAEWDEHANPFLITPRAWYSDDRCSRCGPDTPHDEHATDEERAAHDEAVRWLRERAR